MKFFRGDGNNFTLFFFLGGATVVILRYSFSLEGGDSSNFTLFFFLGGDSSNFTLFFFLGGGRQ